MRGISCHSATRTEWQALGFAVAVPADDMPPLDRNKKRFHQQALMEVTILDHLRRRDKHGDYNVIHMLDYFYFRNHLCVTFQLMG